MKYFDCNAIFGAIRNESEKYLPKDIERLMDKAGIEKALCASSTGYLSDDVTANDYTIEMARKHSRLLPVGTIHPTKFFDVEEEIIRRKAQGFCAFRLFTEFYRVNFDSYQMKEYFSILNKCKMPLIVSNTDLMLTRNDIDAITRRAEEVEIPVIVLNVAGYGLSTAIPCLRRVENIYLSTRLLYTNQALEILCEKIGSNRLLFGSGIPFHYAMQSIYYIENADITEEDKQNILYKNLERLVL